ncbi:MAG: phenylacetate--CoA ligase family protein [Deltaproteobacteria bacterium]|nr:phenylacetate--CoA ligase family protein [Deltaproteobacteria bacterium]
MGLSRTILYCLWLRHDDKLSRERIQVLQQRRLRKMVRFAKARSPFYQDRYRKIDPDAASFSVRDLPPTCKDELMADFDRVVTDPRLKLEEILQWVRQPDNVGRWYKRRFVPTVTSGTTGAPGIFVYDRQEWDWIQAFSVTRGIRFKPSFFQFFAQAGKILVSKVRVALVSVLNGHFVTFILFRMTPKIGRLVSRFHFLSVVDPVDGLIEQLNEIQPNVLHCYPTMLEVLAHAKLDGRLRIEPWVLTASSEPLTRPAREAIAQAFPASPLFETYGTSEGVNLASECQFHRGMHVNTDYFVLESVRADGSPVEPGEVGDKVYLSCLFSRTMPILRYEIGDVTRPIAEPCPCGLPFPLIEVQGRTDDIFWVYDDQDRPVPLPPIPFEALFLNVDGLVQYQLIQQERDLFRILYRVRDGADGAQVGGQIRTRFMDYLAQKGIGKKVRLQIEAVEEIPRDPGSGKVRQIFSRVEQLYLPGQPLGDRRRSDERRSGVERRAGRRESDRRQRERRGDEEDGGE